MDRKPLATPREVSEYTGVPVRTLDQWRWLRNRGPRWVKLDNGRIRYRWTDIDAWLTSRVTGGGPEAAA